MDDDQGKMKLSGPGLSNNPETQRFLPIKLYLLSLEKRIIMEWKKACFCNLSNNKTNFQMKAYIE